MSELMSSRAVVPAPVFEDACARRPVVGLAVRQRETAGQDEREQHAGERKNTLQTVGGHSGSFGR